MMMMLDDDGKKMKHEDRVDNTSGSSLKHSAVKWRRM